MAILLVWSITDALQQQSPDTCMNLPATARRHNSRHKTRTQCHNLPQTCNLDQLTPLGFFWIEKAFQLPHYLNRQLSISMHFVHVGKQV